MGTVAVALAIWLAGLAIHDAIVYRGQHGTHLSRFAKGYRGVLLLLFYVAVVYAVVEALDG